MSPTREVVITGVGVVSPLGIGREAFGASLAAGRSGVRPVTLFDASSAPVHFGAEVADFDPKQFVKQRKSLKVMARDIQLGVSAADMAYTDAGLAGQAIDPERLGVVFGSDLMQCMPEDSATAFRRCTVDGRFDFQLWGSRAMEEIFPLWMLKYLPNMPACHIAIAQDARGPNNTHTLGEVSSLLAISEAVRTIERGQADAMIAGGTGSRIHPTLWVRNTLLEVSRRNEDPARASRPFDADRDGFVSGEGATAFILETRAAAEARGAKIWARIASCADSFEPRSSSRPPSGTATRRVIGWALKQAGCRPADVGHVNAHGMSTIDDDRAEAQAIRAELGDVPVTAPKSYFGYLGTGTGAVEMAVSVLALDTALVPATLNYERPDPACPVNVVRGQPLAGAKPTALVLNQASTGQSAALLLVKD